ncbi:hypothetical protein [Bradyrhizobium sacchari]|uniref:hypothetical protein n=1 Tax=Bradyrhizobium sacchari TaxID=1399419 RepID=UPI0010A97C23|nr:hypothetical protein [Bradyrhizobium sacchari]
MAKAGARKKKKAPPKLSDEELSERFKEAARAIGADISADQFDDLFHRVAKKKPPVKPAD